MDGFDLYVGDVVEYVPPGTEEGFSVCIKLQPNYPYIIREISHQPRQDNIPWSVLYLQGVHNPLCMTRYGMMELGYRSDFFRKYTIPDMMDVIHDTFFNPKR